MIMVFYILACCIPSLGFIAATVILGLNDQIFLACFCLAFAVITLPKLQIQSPGWKDEKPDSEKKDEDKKAD